MSVLFKTRYLKYEIFEDGLNKSFAFANSENRIIEGPAAKIIAFDKSEVYSTRASFSGGILSLGFSDGTEAEILCSEHDEYITFTLKHVSREDFLSISFVNILLEDKDSDYQAVMIGMTLSTHMKEHPGNNRNLVASAYPHIGLYSTARSPYPAKAAFFAAPNERVRDIEKLILDEIPDGEIPKSNMGGPYSDNSDKVARGDYFILMHDTATMDNVDKIIAQMKRFGLTQVNLHHYSHYYQGDFNCRKDKFPNGIEDFKAVVDVFHQHGMKVGLQTYAFFVVPDSSYVTPVPHKDLEIIREFTLADDICESDKALSVCESTEGVDSVEGFVYVNSPYLWIDDELIKFSIADNGKFTITERGAYNTVPAAHKKGSAVKHLKQYFLIPFARVGSELFYEIARKTAEFFNESGADMFYLDALDGTFVLEGEEYVWYHAMDFIREMFKYLKHDIVFNCCYSPQYTGTWFVRSRYGAVDVSLNAHRRYVDAHLNYNNKTAKRMGVTSELGWVDLFPHISANKNSWQHDPVYAEDVEYLCAKAFATESSISFLESFRDNENLPYADTHSEILRKYAAYRTENTPTQQTREYLQKVENGAELIDGSLYRSRLDTLMFEQDCGSAEVHNPFGEQTPTFRLEAFCAADVYDNPKAVELCNISETEPLKSCCIRFDKPVVANGNRGIGVWCKGDGSGALICINLRNFALNKQKSAEYYIKADFTGWKYFAFYKAQNAILPADVYPVKELEYTTYTQLQEFYGYYRINFDFEHIDGVDITVKGSDNIYMKSIRLLPHVEPVYNNPTIKFGESSIKVLGKIPADANLYFDGKSCVITDASGFVLDRPEYVGTPVLKPGRNEIGIERDSASALVCAKLTVGMLGEKLQ